MSEEQNGVGIQADIPVEEPTTNDVTGVTDQPQDQVGDDTPKDNAAWAAMRVRNKELEDKVKQYEQSNPQNEFINPASEYLANQQVNSYDYTNLTNDGYDDSQLNDARSMYFAKQEAERLRADFEGEIAAMKYPEFNKPVSERTQAEIKFLKDTKAYYIAEKYQAKAEGRTPKTLAQVADEVKKSYQTGYDQARQEGVVQANKVMSDKATASVDSGGTGVNMADVANADQAMRLQQATRHGDLGALAERLKASDDFYNNF